MYCQKSCVMKNYLKAIDYLLKKVYISIECFLQNREKLRFFNERERKS